MREFKTNDQVLVCHPIPGAPLREKYAGPYKIVHRTSKVNYILSTPDRKRQTQLVHVNLLKPYITPVKKVSPYIALVITKANTEATKVPNLTIDEETNDVMPFGLCNAPATFQHMMAEITRCIKDVFAYLDDIVIASKTWEEHLSTLEELSTPAKSRADNQPR
ncbi:uncharacterized protein [Palaemon carinicauda]|uniref:uncharacterized protein n=1 Tax=Palaemon carinicauda TaxID=392227 RepID=UPI0035B60569